MIKIVFLLLLFSQTSFARPIFGHIFLLPIETKIPNLAGELEKEFLGNLNPQEFENIISTKIQGALSRLKTRGKKVEYQKIIDRYSKDPEIDLYFNIEIKEEDADQRKLSFSILNKDNKVIYQRESLFEYSSIAEYMNRLSIWMDEFRDFLPPVGKIVSIDDGKISIELTHGSSLLDYNSRPFYIGDFLYDSDFSESKYPKMGAVTASKGARLEAYVYSEYRKQKIKVGDNLIFLNKSSGNLKHKEKIFTSETRFNYINSPKFSLLDCSLLPLIGNMKTNADLHMRLVQMVEHQKLCKFRDDKKLTELLSKYGDDLEAHLNNEVVLRNLAHILRIGAIFRLGVYKVLNGYSIKFDVISENGKNIYYSKFHIMEEYDEDYIAELLLGWILDYKNTLPLTGRVVQIRGSNLLIDIPAGLVEGTKQEFSIIRPVSLRYEEIAGNRKITWKNKTIAYGTINSIRKQHSVGTVFKFAEKNAKVKEGDWIFIEDLSFQIKEEAYLFKKHNLKATRNIGMIKGSTEFTSVSATTKTESIYGVGLGLDFYLPFGFLFTGEAIRSFGGGDQSISNNNFMGAIGYSFTPRIYGAYFSFVDLYLGQRVVNYKLSDLSEKGIGDLKYSGVFIGGRIEIPVYKEFSLQAQIDYAPNDEVENTNTLFGKVESSFGYGAKFIGKYKLSKTKFLFAEYHQYAYKSTYDGDDGVELELKSQLIKLSYGVQF